MPADEVHVRRLWSIFFHDESLGLAPGLSPFLPPFRYPTMIGTVGHLR